MHIISKIKRPAIALATVFGIAAGAAAAADGCYTCPPPAPIQPVYHVPAPAPAIAPVCNPCAGFDASSASAASGQATGINYLIPTVNGMIESPTYNPPMNEVDSYYATHYKL